MGTIAHMAFRAFRRFLILAVLIAGVWVISGQGSSGATSTQVGTVVTHTAAALRDLPLFVKTTAPTNTSESSVFDVAMATAVLTEPDEGTPGKTYRWPPGTVDVFVDTNTFTDPETVTQVAGILDWLSTATGVKFTPSSNPDAPMRVHGSDEVGGLVEVAATHAGVIERADADVGIGRTRVLYEEILQAAGPLGDRADDRSVFSQSKARTTPSSFDRWVLTALYAAPPGTDAATITETLTELRP